MATQPTNKPVPSESPRDLKFNAGKVDEFVNSSRHTYRDRFGFEHYTIEGINHIAQEAISHLGYITVDSFEGGATVTYPNEALRWKENGEYYRWDGGFPKVVPAGSTPESSGGIGIGAWLSIGDSALRSELTSSLGASFIGTGTGESLQTVLDKLYQLNDPRRHAGSSYLQDNSQAFIDAMNSSPAGIVVRGGVFNVGDLTINVPVDFEAGAGISVNNGSTVVINSSITAGNHRIFYGDGSYSLGDTGNVSSLAAWFGASGSEKSAIASVVSGSTAVSISESAGLLNGHNVSIEHAGANSSLTVPTGLTVSATGMNRQGPTGSTKYSYRVASVDESGAMSAASSPVSISNGNDTLGKLTPLIRGLAFNKIDFVTDSPGAAVWRSRNDGPYVLIGIFGFGQADSIYNGVLDAGLPQITIPWVPDVPNESPLAARLVTTVVSGGGTSELTLRDTPQVTGDSFVIRHDDTEALEKLFSISNTAILPPGKYQVGSINVPPNLLSLSGSGYSSEIVGWGTLDPVINAVSMPVGFSVSNLRVDSKAWHNQIGIHVGSTDMARIHNCCSSGNLAIFTTNTSSATISNNIIEKWTDSAIFDHSGDRNLFENNYIKEGSDAIPQNAAAIHGYKTRTSTFKGNTSLGSHIYSIKIEDGDQNNIENNYSYNSWAEAYHLSGSCSGNRIRNNTMFGGSLSMDYAISISNDDTDNAVMFGNEISGNYIYQCGTAAIAVAEFGGSNPNISYTVIKGNTVFGANQNNKPATPEIELIGSGVKNTYISDHHSFSHDNCDYTVKENDEIYGFPVGTQVGTIFGDGGYTSTVSLSGSGSSRLSGGSTGL